MPSSDIFGDFVISKGPLSDEEVLLKELILRDTFYAKTGKGAAAAALAAAQAQSSTSSAMVKEDDADKGTAGRLRRVSSGELITADYMNDIVEAVNALSEQMAFVTKALKKREITDVEYARSKGAAVVNEVREVEVALANQDDQKAVVRIPANGVAKEDIADLLIDKMRFDPDDIKEVDGIFEIIVDKAFISENPRVRVVSQPGESAQKVKGLFR